MATVVFPYRLAQKMGAIEKIISLVSLAVIFGGLTYAYERESLQRSDLNPVFANINTRYFDGTLVGVRVERNRLPEAEQGEARKLSEHEFVIL